LKGGYDDDPDMRTSRLGVVVSLPLWDRRSGPVDEASAQLARSRHALAAQEFSLDQQLAVAYQQYEIALTQVTTLESGIVRQAENALRIAEAAYRFGERGFLEVLDAQRVYRASRAELIAARFELAAAWVEIERLRAAPGGRKE
jgi:cobalt-zinc-cadmium efflux system outer membrane protein